jgi:dCTP deaminase
MAILNGEEIRERMLRSDYDKKLLITPLLDEEQIGPASVDIRLGSSLIISRKTYIESQDVTSQVSARQVERRVYERLRLKYNTKFVLHPNELILGVTFEYISLPSDTFCTVASRSSWGRLGLVVATASAVQPGFKGCLTLELANLSESPIALYPGLPVGQLVFHDVSAQGGYKTYEGRYDCPTEADLPGFYNKGSDKELAFWGE